MRIAMLPILLGLTMFSTGCDPYDRSPSPIVCPKPVKQSEATKQNLRDCCTVEKEGRRTVKPGYDPLWGWLAKVATLNDELEACWVD